MTKKEFIAKHGPFQLNKKSNEMLMKCCHTPEKEHKYGSVFFLTGKMYNHGFYDHTINLDKLETNWDFLSENLDFLNKIESMLEGTTFGSDTEEPYKSFLLTDFKPKKGEFLKSFLTRMGLYFKADGVGVYTNPLFSEIKVVKVSKKGAILMDVDDEEDEEYDDDVYEEYYGESVALLKSVDSLLKGKLKNIHRISFCKSHDLEGGLPTFYVGETKEGSNLLGLFSVGHYN